MSTDDTCQFYAGVDGLVCDRPAVDGQDICAYHDSNTDRTRARRAPMTETTAPSHDREHMPLSEMRAVKYPMLETGVAR